MTGYPYHCEICAETSDVWVIVRRDNGETTWACSHHIDEVARQMASRPNPAVGVARLSIYLESQVMDSVRAIDPG